MGKPNQVVPIRAIGINLRNLVLDALEDEGSWNKELG